MTGTALDQNDRFSSPKSEPSLDEADAFSTAPPVAVHEAPPAAVDTDAGDMPSWLKTPGEEAAEPSAWWRSALWVGGLALVIGAAAVGSNWLLEQQEDGRAVPATAELAPPPAAPAASAAVIAPRPADALPPLVLLPPEQGGKPKVDPTAVPAPAETAPVETPAQAVVADASPVAAAVPATPAAPEPVPSPVPAPAAALPAPVVVKSPEPAPVQPPVVAVPAAAKVATVAAKPGARPAVATRKKPLPAKRVAAAKPAPKKVRGVTLPPPRDRARDDDQDASPSGKCISGELARECEARLRGR